MMPGAPNLWPLLPHILYQTCLLQVSSQGRLRASWAMSSLPALCGSHLSVCPHRPPWGSDLPSTMCLGGAVGFLPASPHFHNASPMASGASELCPLVEGCQGSPLIPHTSLTDSKALPQRSSELPDHRCGDSCLAPPVFSLENAVSAVSHQLVLT